VTRPALPVLIFGADVGPLGVLRALTARGVRCYVADHATDVITKSRWYRSPARTLPETADSAVLADYLRSLDLPGAVLIAGSDRWALAVSGLPDDVRARFPASSSGRDVVEQLIDKDRFGALVSGLQVPHPTTLEITGPADIDRLSDQELRGGFLKPTDSQLHRRHFGAKGSFVRSRAAAIAQVERATALGIEYVYQEWIPGPHSAAILIDGIVDRDGAIRALTARRKIREHPRRLGTTSSSVGIDPSDVGGAVESVKAMLSATSYRGLFNIEFKHDARDGRDKVIEFNPRACAYTGTIASGGVDLPWLAYLDAQGLTVPDAGPYPVGRYALYEISDAKRIVNAVRRGRRPEGAIARTWVRGDRALFWWRDPMPALSMLGRRLGRLVGRSRTSESLTPGR
jgi:predicted ATP-grasp superfamily ATP-dependent carboligase